MTAKFRISIDLAQVNAKLDALGNGATAAARPAAQAGIQVLYNEVQLNVGRIGRVTGNLAASIYQVYSQDNSDETRATYHCSWNARKAPHGHLVEYGHLMTRKPYIGSDGKWYTSKTPIEPRQVGARPFLRPAWDAKNADAQQAVVERWKTDVRGLL